MTFLQQDESSTLKMVNRESNMIHGIAVIHTPTFFLIAHPKPAEVARDGGQPGIPSIVPSFSPLVVST